MITLVLGGTRSGKSGVAERLLAGEGRSATYLATGRAVDADMAFRIAAHQARRAALAGDWSTLEVGTDLPDVLGRLSGPVLVDSLGTWLAGFPELDPDMDALCEALRDRDTDTVVVSEEVGLGVHAQTEVGRRFADRLGELNQAIAQQADTVLLVVAGRVLPLERAQQLRGGTDQAPDSPLGRIT